MQAIEYKGFLIELLEGPSGFLPVLTSEERGMAINDPTTADADATRAVEKAKVLIDQLS